MSFPFPSSSFPLLSYFQIYSLFFPVVSFDFISVIHFSVVIAAIALIVGPVVVPIVTAISVDISVVSIAPVVVPVVYISILVAIFAYGPALSYFDNVTLS